MVSISSKPLFVTVLLIVSASASNAVLKSRHELLEAARRCAQKTAGFWTSEAGRIKRQHISESAKEELLVIADFDRTVTSFSRNGAITWSSVGVLERSGVMGLEYNQRMQALTDKYWPIELNLKLPYSQRRKALDDWWAAGHDLLIESQLTREQVVSAVESAMNAGKITLRYGAEALFRRLHQLNIPLVIFSAGLRETIEVFLQRRGLLLDNMSIVANSMLFNKDDGKLAKFSNSQSIHPLNKGAQAFDDEVSRIVAGRPNVVVLGDSLGDADMADGLEGTATVLKHGFLNHKIGDQLNDYQSKFDELTLNDGSFKSVLEMFEGWSPIVGD